MTTPTRDRPGIPPSYGIAASDRGLLEWEEVSEAFGATPNYWVATTHTDGSPHLIPIWGGWANTRLHIEGGDDTLWYRNLERDPRTQVGADHDDLQIMLRGTAWLGRVDDWTPVEDNYVAKYPYRPEAKEMWQITPTSVLAWRTDTIDAFATTPTRFSFPVS